MWKVLKSEYVSKSGFIKLRVDECELPDGRVMPRYHVIEFPDWVNVIPVTKDKKVVMVRQFRHGAREEFLEIPGGGTDPRFVEDPQAGGARELVEETGYTSQRWESCGYQYPNPALQNNKLHVFIAWDCEKTDEQKLDPFEDLTVELVPLEEVLRMWKTGEFKHSLILSSIGLALTKLEAALR